MQYGTEDNSTVVIVPFGAWGKYKNGEINFSFSRSFASSGRWAWRPDTAIFSCNNTDTTCYKRTHPSVHRLTQCLVHLFCCQLWKMQPLLWCVIAAYSWSHFTVFIYSDQHWVSRPSSSAHHFICTVKSLGLSYDTSVSSQLLLPSTQLPGSCESPRLSHAPSSLYVNAQGNKCSVLRKTKRESVVFLCHVAIHSSPMFHEKQVKYKGEISEVISLWLRSGARGIPCSWMASQ